MEDDCITLENLRISDSLEAALDTNSHQTNPDTYQKLLGINLIQKFRKHAPLALITIENPVNDVFGHLPGIRKLLRSSEWRMLAASYCQEADEVMDPGYWPRKDTNVLTCGLPSWFHGKLCDNNCKHLVPGTCRHRVQLCSGSYNLPSQYVIRDPMVKGMIPHGFLHGIFMAHLEWRQDKERPVLEKEVRKHSSQWDADVRAETERSVLKRSLPVGAAYVMCAHSLELTASFLNTATSTAECHVDEAEDFPEELDDIAEDELLEPQDNDAPCLQPSRTGDQQIQIDCHGSTSWSLRPEWPDRLIVCE